MIYSIILIAESLFIAMLMTKVAKVFKLPNVTAYLIAGIIMGPAVLGRLGIRGLGFIGIEEVEKLSIFSDIALGFIAFAIGSEFKLESFKKTGKEAFVISLSQAFLAMLCVGALLIIVHMIIPSVVTIPMALTLGAIASTTAPAALLMIVKQYKPKGVVTDILLPVVAINDAISLIIFSIAFGIAEAMLVQRLEILNIIVEPIIEIVASALLGFILAKVLSLLEKRFSSKTDKLILIIAFIIAALIITERKFFLGSFKGSFSYLLVCMVFGASFCNLSVNAEEMMEKTNDWASPILVLFFLFSGAELDLFVFKNLTVVIIGLIYVLARSFGKYFGTKISATAVGSDEKIRKYLGTALLPQAGVAIGMSAIAAKTLGVDGLLVRNITLFGVLVFESIGPILTKTALIKAGEMNE